MTSEAWQMIMQAALIIATLIVSWYHKESIVRHIKDAPPLTFEVQIVIDRTGKVPPKVTVMEKPD